METGTIIKYLCLTAALVLNHTIGFKKTMLIILAVGGVIFAVISFEGYEDSAGKAKASQTKTKSQTSPYIKDLLTEYKIAYEARDKRQTCIHAGLISSGYLNEHNAREYEEWRKTEESECYKWGLVREGFPVNRVDMDQE